MCLTKILPNLLSVETLSMLSFYLLDTSKLRDMMRYTSARKDFSLTNVDPVEI